MMRALGVSIAAFCVAVPCMAALEIREGDAFARSDPGKQLWAIGTKAVQMVYDCRDGQLRLVSVQNNLTDLPWDYASPSAPFGVDPLCLGSLTPDSVWSRLLVAGMSVDPGVDNLRLAVEKDDLVGFGVATSADDAGATVNWTTTLDYGDGHEYVSSDDTELVQGPIWHYYAHAPGTGCMDTLGEVLESPAPGQDKARVPSGFRAPAECSSLGATRFRLVNAYELIRVWKAPKDGVVDIRGGAEYAGGDGQARISVYRIVDRTSLPAKLPDGYDRWILESGAVRQIGVGGRPAVQLELTLNRDGLRAYLYVQAYPRTSVLRQWVEFENATASPRILASPTSLSLSLRSQETSDMTHYWMCGGTSRPNQGQLESAQINDTYHRTLLGDRTDNYVPWMALTRNMPDKPGGGLFVALDHLGTWTLGFDRAAGHAVLSASFPGLVNYSLAAGERLQLPLITLGVFTGDLDDMGRRVYDWQYEYLWDYTNGDYYARTKWAVPWFFCSRNLQEQFTARLAFLDMDADLMRAMGMEMLWDDAGWSKYPGWPIEDSYAVVFSPTHEGPDFAETLRYLDKMDMKWLLWMAGRPSAGLLDTKVGAWGNFQWRTDGFGRFGLKGEHAIREQIERFLQANPRCSFHTCCGGSRYAHQFEIQRYADVNYLSDMGRGEQTNHYFSYLEVPDKWVDLLEALLQSGSKYNPDTGPGMLSMVPGWYLRAEGPEQDQLRRLMEIYRYLRQEGVTGRWSHMMHPGIKNDEEYYYDQRISYDAKKACIVLKHRPKGEVTIYPKGLLPEHGYEVGYECSEDRSTRTGADLMATGVVLTDPPPGELIYFGLSDMPGAGRDATPPTAPGRAFARCETNIGHSGVAVYWSPGFDDNWISLYEVSRDGNVIGKVSIGTYYFDHSPGWNINAPYAVRAVNGEGKTSEWTSAERMRDGPNAYAALGGHFSQTGRDGWKAETSADGRTFVGMTWVPPTRSAAGDLGGTPNQPGGVEGYWEGPGQARVGRGWQQASQEAVCVRAWTAPTAGEVTVVGRVIKECYRQAMGNPLHVRILHNDTQVWPEQGWAEVPINSLRGIMHHSCRDVAVGDTIRFVLDRGTSPDTDIIAWMPRIVYATPDSARQGTCLRILCGAKEDYTDHTGNVWSRDAFFTGGDAVSTSAPVRNASPTDDDQELYQNGRTGRDFTYAVPVEPGIYALRLKLAEIQYAWSFERPFDLSINGRRVLDNFDVCQAAHGPNIAYERVFRHLVPDEEGRLVLRFTSGFEPMQKTDKALVQAIEILPEARQVVRIDAGADKEFIDWNSFIWSADAQFDGGTAIQSEAPVSQASPTLYDQALYQTARSGNTFGYSVPLLPGVYTVQLKFAELWLNDLGQRPMRIEVNGRVVRESWDPAQAAGQAGMAADVRVEGVTPDAHGEITIRMKAMGLNDAILQGIQVE